MVSVLENQVKKRPKIISRSADWNRDKIVSRLLKVLHRKPWHNLTEVVNPALNAVDDLRSKTNQVLQLVNKRRNNNQS